MPAFGTRSLERLATCHPDLQRLFNTVVAAYDCTILEGHRSAERQAELLAAGKTKVAVSKHNADPSRAVDAAPWPIPDEWGINNPKVMSQFYEFGGYVQGVAQILGIPLRWGGDWDGDHVFTDQSFDDLVHFELRD
jgi:peptidoglycan L-alanyl-D-glutamate endopeptidase CwlK